MAREVTLPENAYFEELTPMSQQRNNSGDEVEEQMTRKALSPKGMKIKFQNTRA